MLNQNRSDGPIVIKVGGALLDDPAALSLLLDGVVAAHDAGQPMVIVHGGGAAVDRHLSRLGHATERIDGIRCTPPDQMIEVTAVLAGAVSKTLVASLRARGVAAVGLCLGDDDGLNVQRLQVSHFDPGCVGTVGEGRSRLLPLLLESGRVPIVSSIGIDDQGTLLNVNADDAAAGVAAALGAVALLLLTNVPGVLDAAGCTIPRLDQATIGRLAAEGVIHGGMLPKVQAAAHAASVAGCPALIGSWSDPDILRDPWSATGATTISPAPTSSPTPAGATS